MSRRTERMDSLIQAELAELILKKLKDPRVGFVTVTNVKTSPDLKEARAYYSVLGQAKEKSAAGAGLEHARGFLQHEIAEALKLRFTPKLIFHLDESVEEGFRIDQILNDWHREDEARSPKGSR